MSVKESRLLPLVGVEFGANVQIPSQSINPLIVGLTHENIDEKIYKVTNVAQAYQLFGYGSQLALMLEGYLKRGDVAVDVLAIKNDAGDKEVVHEVDVSGTITKAGQISVSVANENFLIPFSASEAIDDILTRGVKIINDNKLQPFNVSTTTGKLTFTSKAKGAFTNGIEVKINKETSSSEWTYAMTITTQGTGTPAGAKVVGLLGDKHYNMIIHNLPDVVDDVHDELKKRWQIDISKEGMQFLVSKDTYSNLYGTSDKNQRFTCMTAIKKQATREIVEHVLGQLSREIYENLAVDPSAPIRNKELSISYKDNFSDTERELLLQKGYSTVKPSGSDKMVIEKLVTTYRKTPDGIRDMTFLDINVFFTLSSIRYEVTSHFTVVTSDAKYIPKLKVRLRGKQKVITNNRILTDMIALFVGGTSTGLGDFMGKGWVQDFDPKKDIRVETVKDNYVRVYFNEKLVKPLNVFHGVSTYQ